MKYTAFGEIRDINSSSPTDYLYTGQRKEVEFGLSYYVARWYDSYLNQFTQPDTIIPEPGISDTGLAITTGRSRSTAGGKWRRIRLILLTPTVTPTTDPQALPDDFSSASYTYDGDDNMVKSVIDGVTTYYVGGYYELRVEDSVETEVKYYYAASRRIAMRTITSSTDTLHWLISDHLSSTTIITDDSGTIVSEMKYTAFGEIRDINGTSPTDYLYTGQRKEAEFGLSYYVARWYDASTGHFTSADTLIPEPGDSGTWDRYAYVNYNSINFNDPTGHIPQIEGDDPLTHWVNQQAAQEANEIYIIHSNPEYSLLTDPGLPQTVKEQILYSTITRQINWDRHPIFTDTVSAGWNSLYTANLGYGTVTDYRNKEFGLFREFCAGSALAIDLDIEYSSAVFDGYSISDIEDPMPVLAGGFGIPGASIPGAGFDIGIEKEVNPFMVFDNNRVNHLGYNVGFGFQEMLPFNAEFSVGVCWSKILWRTEWGE